MKAHRSLTVGDRLDRFTLLRPVGQGGMGSVWLALETSGLGFARRVALKTILPTFAGARRFRDMFLDEADLGWRVDHPNLARVVEAGESEGILFLVTEWIEGESLERICRTLAHEGGRVPWPIAVRVVSDACGGLHALHHLSDREGLSLEVVHRDVSPENVLVSAHGVATLIDLGIARARVRRADPTGAGVVRGKPGFISPEQALEAEVDCRTDVWAMGAVLYRVLSGAPPLTDLEQATRFALGKRTIDELSPETPGELKALTMRALARNPRDRFRSSSEMQRELERALVARGHAVTTNDVAVFLRDALHGRPWSDAA